MGWDMRESGITDAKHKLLEELPVALAVFRVIDGKSEPLILSEGFLRLFGRSSRKDTLEEMAQNPSLCRPEDAENVVGRMMRFLHKGSPFEAMYRAIRNCGPVERLIHAKGEKVSAEDGTELFYIWFMEGPPAGDVHGQPGPPPGINTDLLIDLPDKSVYFPSAIRKSREMIQSGCDTAFLFFDLNGMKFYNNRFSFEEGNRLLKSYGALLADTFGKENCCHLGGDHYTAYHKAEGLEEILKEFFEKSKKLNEGNSLPVHVGVYVDQNAEFPITVAVDRAKFACDSLRDIYESRYHYYSETLNDDLNHRRYILSYFDQAMEEGWIQVYYQPIVRAVNSKVCDEEALARWIDPEKGVMTPDEFIPILEEARVIYKMDLYVLEQVLKKLRLQEELGLYLVPQSINVSRSDFDSCDMVEEVRKRVDEAGFDHRLITIEVTESMVGSNLEFMKKQIKRFRELGFPVWMDDFGSGYSSIDVMQRIRFDLIKFDMNFLKRMDEGRSGRLILSELMHMAIAMNVDTVCEGVETKEQVSFLREIGCSKLQGFYFSKPNPISRLHEIAKEGGGQLGFENPAESGYYETMGRINLYDLSAVPLEDDSLFRNYLDILPMAVLEIKEGCARYTRSNPSYRFFAKRFFGFDLSDMETIYTESPKGVGYEFVQLTEEKCAVGKWAYIDETMADGSRVHSFLRKIADNPVTGEYAVLIIVLSVENDGIDNTYENVARVLAPDAFKTYYVNLDSDDYVKYSVESGEGVLAVERRGKHFFESVRRDSSTFVYQDDLDAFLEQFTKEAILSALEREEEFRLTYLHVENGKPIPAELKAERLQNGDHHLIIEVRLLENTP